MKVKINKNIFDVKTLVDKKSQEIGMMKKTFDGFDGLLFLMGGKTQCFWMKDCIVDIDIIMIQNNTITKIFHDCPPCKHEVCLSYCGKGNIVLELPGGTCNKLGIKKGDDVIYLLS